MTAKPVEVNSAFGLRNDFPNGKRRERSRLNANVFCSVRRLDELPRLARRKVLRMATRRTPRPVCGAPRQQAAESPGIAFNFGSCCAASKQPAWQAVACSRLVEYAAGRRVQNIFALLTNQSTFCHSRIVKQPR